MLGVLPMDVSIIVVHVGPSDCSLNLRCRDLLAPPAGATPPAGGGAVGRASLPRVVGLECGGHWGGGGGGVSQGSLGGVHSSPLILIEL